MVIFLFAVKSKLFFPVVSTIVLICAGVPWWWNQQAVTLPSDSLSTTTPRPKASEQVSRSSSPIATTKSTLQAAVVAPPLSRDDINTEIHDAVTTYEPGGLTVLEKYLTHPDPEIRADALDGCTQMGLSQAAPMLRKAAAQLIASAPSEAAKYLQIADFLELPDAPRRRHTQPSQSTDNTNGTTNEKESGRQHKSGFGLRQKKP